MKLKKDESGQHVKCKYCGVNLTEQEENTCIWCVESLESELEWCEEEQRWV